MAVGFRSANSLLKAQRSGLDEADARLAAKLAATAALPTRTHEVTLEVFEELLSLGLRMSEGVEGEQAPVQFKVILRMINESRPLLAKYVGRAPVEELQRFMAMLIAKMQRIVDEPAGGQPSADPSSDANRSGSDRASA